MERSLQLFRPICRPFKPKILCVAFRFYRKYDIRMIMSYTVKKKHFEERPSLLILFVSHIFRKCWISNISIASMQLFPVQKFYFFSYTQPGRRNVAGVEKQFHSISALVCYKISGMRKNWGKKETFCSTVLYSRILFERHSYGTEEFCVVLLNACNNNI